MHACMHAMQTHDMHADILANMHMQACIPTSSHTCIRAYTRSHIHPSIHSSIQLSISRMRFYLCTSTGHVTKLLLRTLHSLHTSSVVDLCSLVDLAVLGNSASSLCSLLLSWYFHVHGEDSRVRVRATLAGRSLHRFCAHLLSLNKISTQIRQTSISTSTTNTYMIQHTKSERPSQAAASTAPAPTSFGAPQACYYYYYHYCYCYHYC